VEAEGAYWTRKQHRGMTPEEDAAAREFSRILHAYLSPGELFYSGLHGAPPESKEADRAVHHPMSVSKAGPTAVSQPTFRGYRAPCSAGGGSKLGRSAISCRV
jgi:hypothetical protein